MSVILETKQLCKFYGTGENQVKAVNHVNIQIQQGESKQLKTMKEIAAMLVGKN